MSKYIITGLNKLHGVYCPSGAKNAAIKMIAASILTPEKIILKNCPNISDTLSIIQLIEGLGARVKFEKNIAEIDPSNITHFYPNDEISQKIRASVALVGPLLGRFKQAKIIHPGGCLIGNRPLDSTFSVLKQFGVKIKTQGKHYILNAKNLTGKIVVLPEMSVSATETAILTSVLAKGKTQIRVAAIEPEIIDLMKLLNKMGAKIHGIGKHTINIIGVKKLHKAEHKIISDRIEIGTLVCASLATNSQISIKNVCEEHLDNFLIRIKNMGGIIRFKKNDLHVYPSRLNAIKLDTRPFPGFPTDLQSPIAALMTQAEGTSRIFETLYEGRFNYINELNKMGAKTRVINDYIVEISGKTKLIGRNLECTDLRAGAALVISGLIAKGKTVINNIELIERGYEEFDEKLRKIGAKIIKC